MITTPFGVVRPLSRPGSSLWYRLCDSGVFLFAFFRSLEIVPYLKFSVISSG